MIVAAMTNSSDFFRVFERTRFLCLKTSGNLTLASDCHFYIFVRSDFFSNCPSMAFGGLKQVSYFTMSGHFVISVSLSEHPFMISCFNGLWRHNSCIRSLLLCYYTRIRSKKEFVLQIYISSSIMLWFINNWRNATFLCLHLCLCTNIYLQWSL